MSSLFESTYNPDVLSCIANLSNDEVFTPPELANQTAYRSCDSSGSSISSRGMSRSPMIGCPCSFEVVCIALPVIIDKRYFLEEFHCFRRRMR